MLNSIIGKLLLGLGDKMSGWKTIIGGSAAILYGIVGVIHLMFPNDVPGPEVTFDECITYIMGGLAAIGIGHKIDKNTKAVENSSSPKKEK